MKHEMASVKQQTFILGIPGVHSLLERGVNYLVTAIIKTWYYMVKSNFEISHSEY